MWRIINYLTKGVRSVRPSQCCSQDYADEGKKHHCEPLPQKSVTLPYYFSSSPWQQITTFRDIVKAVNYINSGQIHPSKVLEHETNCKICKLAKLYNGLQEKKQKWNGSDTEGNVLARYTYMPPWHWEILLTHNSDENVCEKEEEKKEKDGEEKTQDWSRSYHRQQREKFLLTQSFLQAVSWGSAAALTWSILHYWNCQRRIHLWTSKLQLKQTDFGSKYQVVSPCYNEADKRHVLWHGKNIIEQYLPNKANVFLSQHCSNYRCKSQCTDDHQCLCHSHIHIHDFQCQPYKEIPPNLHYYFNPEVNRSIFSSLWTIAANQPELKKAVHGRAKEINKPEHSLSADLKISGIHSRIQKSSGESDRQESEAQSKKNKIESCEVAKAHSLLKDEHSTQTYKVVLENSEGSSKSSQNLEVHELLQTSNIVQKQTKDSHDDQQELTRGSEIEIDCIADCKSVAKKIEGHGESVLFVPGSHIREKVEIEDCSCDVTGQSKGISISSRYQDTKTGIDKFSDSLMQILNAGSEDIKSIQDQLMGVLEGDVGLNLVDTEPGSAVIYFRAGALLGDPSSTFNLALCYHLGRGVRQDFKMARELYEAANLAGHGWATYNLAVLLSHGEGGPSDLDRAHKLLIQAGNKGVYEAQEALKQLEELDEDDRKESVLRSSQSEPTLTSLSSRKWSSSHSTSDLGFLEESNEWLSVDFSVNSDRSRNTKASFYLN